MIAEIVQQLYSEQFPLIFSFGKLLGGVSKLSEIVQTNLVFGHVIITFTRRFLYLQILILET